MFLRLGWRAMIRSTARRPTTSHSLLHGVLLRVTRRLVAGEGRARRHTGSRVLVQLDDRGEVALKAPTSSHARAEGVPVPMMTWREGARTACVFPEENRSRSWAPVQTSCLAARRRMLPSKWCA
jgi:hypothetical protein